jgi:hypothetical protein
MASADRADFLPGTGCFADAALRIAKAMERSSKWEKLFLKIREDVWSVFVALRTITSHEIGNCRESGEGTGHDTVGEPGTGGSLKISGR